MTKLPVTIHEAARRLYAKLKTRSYFVATGVGGTEPNQYIIVYLFKKPGFFNRKIQKEYRGFEVRIEYPNPPVKSL